VTQLRNWLLGIAGTVFLTGALYAADSRWLQKSEFSAYLEQQEMARKNAEIREAEYELIEIDAKLRYENLSPERRATLEQKKEFLLQTIRDLEAQ
jgi:hypothetical protein